MKKIIIISIFLILVGTGAHYLQPEEKRPHLTDWLNHTQSLISNAQQFIGTLSGDSAKTKAEHDNLDHKLQALLPSEHMDLNYHAATDASPAVDTIEIKPLSTALPNLFTSETGPSTSVSGQVHMDEDDNIIGAEVKVAIPTNL